MKRCLVYLGEAQLNDAVAILEVVRQMYDEASIETVVLVINRDYDGLLGAFDRIITLQHEGIALYDQKAVCQVVQALEDQWHFDAILVPASPFGRMLAPRVAMALHVGLVADVTGIKRDGQGLKMIRPAYSGSMLAEIMTTGKRPYMMSIRQGVFSYEGLKNKATHVTAFDPGCIKTVGLKQIAIEEKPVRYDIKESDVLISGGGGIVKDYHQLEALAHELSGQVSASRKIVDQGMAPRSIQVGQSGKTVSPKLYMALGIHGAIQHVEGLRSVETIIAVNTNKDAPICSLADLVVIGDAGAFVNRLIEKIKSHQS